MQPPQNEFVIRLKADSWQVILQPAEVLEVAKASPLLCSSVSQQVQGLNLRPLSTPLTGGAASPVPPDIFFLFLPPPPENEAMIRCHCELAHRDSGVWKPCTPLIHLSSSGLFLPSFLPPHPCQPLPFYSLNFGVLIPSVPSVSLFLYLTLVLLI